jgi:hypothetical protein
MVPSDIINLQSVGCCGMHQRVMYNPVPQNAEQGETGSETDAGVGQTSIRL